MTCICYESKLTILVGLPDLCNLLVTTGAQDFNEALYICSFFTDSTVQSFGIIESLCGREEKAVYKKENRKRRQRRKRTGQVEEVEEGGRGREGEEEGRRRGGGGGRGGRGGEGEEEEVEEEGRRRWKKKDKELQHRGTLGSIKATMHSLKLPEVSDLSSCIRSWRRRGKMVKDLKSFLTYTYTMCVHVHTHIYMYAHTYTHTHLVVECLELFADFLSMTIAPLGQHTYNGCLIRALCVWGEVGEGGV